MKMKRLANGCAALLFPQAVYGQSLQPVQTRNTWFANAQAKIARKLTRTQSGDGEAIASGHWQSVLLHGPAVKAPGSA
jgi:hypothetical protein